MPGITYAVRIHCFKLTNLSQLNCAPLCAINSEETLEQCNARRKNYFEQVNPQLANLHSTYWVYNHESTKEFGYSMLNMRVPSGTNTLCIENNAKNGYDMKTSYTVEFYDHHQRSIELKKIETLHEKNIFTVILPAHSIWFRYVIDCEEDDSYFNCHYYNGQKTCQTCRRLFEQGDSSSSEEEDF